MKRKLKKQGSWFRRANGSWTGSFLKEYKDVMAGKIYGVGVGPGDPELLTIKAARLIKKAGVIGIPAAHKETCKAYQIAAGAVEEIREKEVVPFPFLMTRDPERLKAVSYTHLPRWWSPSAAGPIRSCCRS